MSATIDRVATPEPVPVSTLLSRYHAPPAIQELALKQPTAIGLFNELVELGQFGDAIDLLAHWMPAQASVWWGCLTLWEAYRKQEPPHFSEAMQLIIAWLQRPEESQRRELVQVEGWFSTKVPMGLLAKAACFSHGSMAGPDVPPVPPPPFLYAVFSAAAIKLQLALKHNSPEALLPTQVIQFGREVLAGQNQWTDDAK